MTEETLTGVSRAMNPWADLSLNFIDVIILSKALLNRALSCSNVEINLLQISFLILSLLTGAAMFSYSNFLFECCLQCPLPVENYTFSWNSGALFEKSNMSISGLSSKRVSLRERVDVSTWGTARFLLSGGKDMKRELHNMDRPWSDIPPESYDTVDLN